MISDLHAKGALPQICEVEFSWFPGSKSGVESCKPGSQLINGIIVRPGKKIGDCHCSTLPIKVMVRLRKNIYVFSDKYYKKHIAIFDILQSKYEKQY